MSIQKLIVILLLTAGSTLHAQIEAHYWTHQYGAKGLLLNGAVIASADDETSLYYNPGSIGMDENLGFAFSFLSPTFSRLSTNNFIGDNNTITDIGVDLSPGFLAVRYKPFSTDKIVAGVTAFKRFKTDIRLNDRVVDQVNNDSQLFRGDVDFSRRTSEDWFGIGISYNLIENLGFGLTQFFIFSSDNFDFNFKKEIFATTDLQTPLFSSRSEFGYGILSQLGLLTKFGLSYRSHYFSIGATYTTPTYFRVRTDGNYFIEDFKINNVANSTSALSNRKPVDVEAIISPASYGFGIDCLFSKTRISISSEYFSSIDRYTIFEDIDDSFDQLTEEPITTNINVQTQNSRVINVAVGIQHKVNENKTLLGGFRTDFDQGNNLIINNESEYLGSTGDIFHISTGGMFQYGKNVFSIGVDLGIGGNTGASQLVDLSNINEENIFSFSDNNNVTNNFSSLMIFITYDFIFSRIGNK